ncbi:hypothetical protein [Tabrizicola sp. M-4]|uniref:hypothetical protein n=1 Tax=Tabrizicola sp. M-4 TaxID=3055847 RepID=UPI003DA891EE
MSPNAPRLIFNGNATIAFGFDDQRLDQPQLEQSDYDAGQGTRNQPARKQGLGHDMTSSRQ